MKHAWLQVWLPLFVLTLAWMIHYERVQVRERVTELQSERHYPFLINGLMIDLGAHTKKIAEWSSLQYGKPRVTKHVVLVFSDLCGFSRRNMPNWDSLLSHVAWDGTQDLIFISMDSTTTIEPLLSKARALAVSYSVFLVTSRTLFKAETGVVGTPTTFVLDSDRRVRLVQGSYLNDGYLSAFIEYLNGHVPSTT